MRYNAGRHSEDFSELDELESCRLRGKLHLKLVWPNMAAPNSQEWKQAINPVVERWESQTLEVRCPPLPPLEGGTIELTNGLIAPDATYTCGSVATYTCDGEDSGPPSDGDATRTCQPDGSWSGTAPTSCASPCGQAPEDCFSNDGCLTPQGRCVSFTCRQQSSGTAQFCANTKGAGWSDVTRSEWIDTGNGVCQDIYEATWQAQVNLQHSNMCGAASGGSEGCSSYESCDGSDNAWAFRDANEGSNYYMGPYTTATDGQDCVNDVLTYNDQDDGNSIRLTVCIKL